MVRTYFSRSQQRTRQKKKKKKLIKVSMIVEKISERENADVSKRKNNIELNMKTLLREREKRG